MTRIEWQNAAATRLAKLLRSEADPSPERRVATILTPLLEAIAEAQAVDDQDALYDLYFLPREVTGSNLLGKQLRKWSGHTPDEIASELASLIADADWRAEIDALLATFEPTRPQSLTTERTPDAQVSHQPGQTVQGNQQNITGTVNGPVVAGNVGQIGDIINPPPPDPAKERATDAEATYLRRLRVQSNALPLAQDNRAAGDRDKEAKTPALVNVYVDLQVNAGPTLEQILHRMSVPFANRKEQRTQLAAWLKKVPGERNLTSKEGGDETILDAIRYWAANADREKYPDPPLFAYGKHTGDLRTALRPQSALEALAANRRLVLLGDPGGGKSTFVNHLAYLCAGARLGEETGWQAALGHLFPAPLLPLRVILRRWSSRLTARDEAGPELVYAALMEETKLERDALLHRLNQPDTLVLLDGLDEAPGADPNDPASLDRRRLIVESVEAFCAARPLCRILVTCRVKPYPAYRLSAIPDFTLAELDDPRIERFLQRWYGEMARTGSGSPAKAEADRAQLQAALGRRADLRQMAAIPLLATMLARVNARSGLPDNRADLYHECVEQLLWEWEASKSREGGERTGLVELLQAEGVGLKRGDLERVLWELTYAAHEQSGAATADLPADTLRARLAAKHPRTYDGWAWAARVVDLMAERSGLLVESETGTFTFPHRTFQEYLAARWLLEQEDCPQQAARLAASDSWREVILLACGYATSKSAFNTTQAILFELLGETDFISEEVRRRLLVAGQGWLEFGPHRAVGATGERLKKEMPPLLTALMQSRDVPPKQRLEAGLILADLHILPDDLGKFVLLPPTGAVPYAFQIGKYPVTNAQYRRFVEAGGYDEDQPWWIEKAVAELDRYDSGWREGPRYWDDADYNRSTQPVVGVSWYEAVAYCVWLTGKLRREGKIGVGEAVRLPTEDEWERAARGPHPPPSRFSPRSRGRSKSAYPWGNDFDAVRANTAESVLNQPSPVHQYPDGATPEGVWDLAGNVYEWTAQIDKGGRVPARGGTSWSEAEHATASGRDSYLPIRRNYRSGFRLVCVPLFRGGSAF